MWGTEHKVGGLFFCTIGSSYNFTFIQTDDCARLPVSSAQATSCPRPACLPQVKVFQIRDTEPPQKAHLGAQVCHTHILPLNPPLFPGLHQAATFLTLSTSGCSATPTGVSSSTRRGRCSKPSSTSSPTTCSYMATARPRPTSGICIR